MHARPLASTAPPAVPALASWTHHCSPSNRRASICRTVPILALTVNRRGAQSCFPKLNKTSSKEPIFVFLRDLHDSNGPTIPTSVKTDTPTRSRCMSPSICSLTRDGETGHSSDPHLSSALREENIAQKVGGWETVITAQARTP